MKTRCSFIGAGVGLVLIGLLLGSAGGQEDMTEVDTAAFARPQRPAVRFEHEQHNEDAGLFECNRCHHVYDEQGRLLEDESSEDMYCSDCHGARPSGRRPSLTAAFHLNCKGCHLQERRGPVMCGECHVRR